MALQHIRSGTANKRPVASSLADGQLAINYQADSPGAFFKDSAGNLVKVGPIHVGPTAPNVTPAGSSGNSLGEGWLDNSGVDAILKVWDGTAWTPAKALVSGDIEITSINSGPLAGFRNAIINGGFDIWQRGTSFVGVTSGYTADRWAVASDGGGSRTVSLQGYAPGQTQVPGEPKYHLQFEQTVAASGATVNNFVHRIEEVRTLAGQTCTVSFYMKCAGSVTVPAVALSQFFGTGGSAAVATTLGTNLALTTNWQYFTFTTTLPSITGKTIGDGSYLVLRFELPLTGTFTVMLGQVQVEPGPVATPFERRSFGLEFLLCQRYYQIQTCYGRSYANALATVRCDKVQLVPRIRTAPTVTVVGPSYINASNLQTDTITARYVGLLHTHTAANVNASSSAEIHCDAEL